MPSPYDVIPAVGTDQARSDAELVGAGMQDPAAVSLLYARHAPRVYWFLYSRTQSREDAADLTQQVFLRCYEGLPHYEDRGIPFSAWLFRIARNVVVDFRRRQRATISWDRLFDGGLRGRAAHDPGPAAKDDDLDVLDSLLAGLPPDHRELIALRFGADLSVTEIAAALGKSEAAVRKQLQRIIHGLKEAYDGS